MWILHMAKKKKKKKKKKCLNKLWHNIDLYIYITDKYRLWGDA